MRLIEMQQWAGTIGLVAPPQTSPLATKLTCFLRLSAEETAALRELAHRTKEVAAEQVFVHDGAITNHVFLVLEGFAYRYKLLSDGRRQILGFLLPGDFCNLDFAYDGHADHFVAAMQETRIGVILISDLSELRAKYPNVDKACSLALLFERSILRQWIVNVGQRNAVQRLGHLFCEVSFRMRAIARQNEDDSINFPLTQAAIADTIGLTTVHVNRSLKKLRTDGLIAFRSQCLTILDHDRLVDLSGFDEDYLRLMCYPSGGAQARNNLYGASSVHQAV